MARGPLSTLVGTLRRTSEAFALDDLPDAELLNRYRATRDESAFAVIVKRHGPLVIAAARQLLTDPADVDDAFQAAWLLFVRESQSIRDGAALSGWLYRVAYRIAVRLKQRQDKRRELGETGTAELDLSWREAVVILHEELDRLPEKFRLPLVLCYLDGRSRDEAAKQLGWSDGMVKGRLERGRNMLRERLTYRGVTLSAGLLAGIAASRAQAVAPHLVNSLSRFLINPAVAPAGLTALCAGVAPTMMTPRRWPLAAAIFVFGLLGTGALLLAMPKPAEPPAKPQAAKPESEKLTLAGRVVDSNGKPIEGARLHWPKLSDIDLRRPDEEKITAPVRAKSDKDGRYSLEVPANDAPKGLPLPLMVLADGYGIGWVNNPPFGGTADVKLTPEHLIKGRAVDTQGKALAGVDVQIVALIAPNDGKLDEFMAAWKRDWQMAPRQAGKIMYFPMNRVAGKTTTDADGRFELKNVARGYVAQVQIGGGAASQQSLYVVNEPGFDPAPINKAVIDKQPPGFDALPGQIVRLAGPTFEHVAAPTKLIEGVVTDATTGKPIGDVRVSSATGHGQASSAKTDAQGRFRLAGLNKTREHLVTFNPPPGGTLMMHTIRVPDSEGLTPIRADVQLNHGVVIQGQVIDKSTGKGVRAAVRFAPLPENKYFGKKPGFDTYKANRTMSETDGEGRFRIVTIPGSGVLMCQAYTNEIIDNHPVKPWLPAEFDEEDRAKVKVDDREPPFRSFAVAGGGTDTFGTESAVKVVDSEEGSGPVTVNLHLRRGVTKTLKIIDPDGKPVAGATVSGVTASFPTVFTIKGDSCTLVALEPKKTRTIAVLHPDRKLAGVATISGDDSGVYEMKLLPTASIKGRLLDMDGNPITGAAVSANYADHVGRELLRFVKPTPHPVKTDAEGRFEVTGVVPALATYLDANKDRKSLIGEPRITPMTLKSGDTHDLGDRKMRPAQ